MMTPIEQIKIVIDQLGRDYEISAVDHKVLTTVGPKLLALVDAVNKHTNEANADDPDLGYVEMCEALRALNEEEDNDQ